MLGIIGGTGLTQLANLKITRRQLIRTPYGEPSGPLTFGELGGKSVVFLARHGSGHTIPPHGVNYRANLWALHSEGVRDIVAVATVGGIHADLGPGTIALPDQIIDYTHGRKNTYYDDVDKPVIHIDFTEPYCPRLRGLCLQASRQSGEPLIDGGVYAAMQGPRLETAAEINKLERDGATMVGMTGMPEAVLARELEISYAAICPVVNHAAGRGSSAHGIRYEEIGAVLDQTMERVRNLIEQVVMNHAD
ncbi:MULTISPECIES: S-methyl-5'-thioinosine phosphorylase [Methylovorus]|jgi:5'-methylthioinosine phosphorylase|uniref:Probable 6-oxopurine nucleoside phosphorylase n=1 Tax=Methylovorus glucosotrophus (strain SIP3-4) TaxID=582744 RepID=C6XDN8_METGS|nr:MULTISPECIES: S-methyl-5'-thioinosine phosphorylase [Methylovorus]ACT50663.1 methylthioadenosine phosphorylase [Methylovorus glucosotrophus SIP3-4]ADQ84650.1 methylthioadenosine phosphorylase [Methylovorus sp. MP688]KAF0843928.1 methylthioadenosine phosphorylase [Methylovorus glucosotrophus]